MCFDRVNRPAISYLIHPLYATVSSGYVARESVRVANLTVPDQAFGNASFPRCVLVDRLTFVELGVVNETTVSFTDEISGILGLGFPRLSQIYNTTAHGNDLAVTQLQRRPFLK